MQVRYSRTIRPAEYESETFEVVIDESGFPHQEGEGVESYVARLHYAAYRQILFWLRFKGEIASNEALVAELARFKKCYRLGAMEAVA